MAIVSGRSEISVCLPLVLYIQYRYPRGVLNHAYPIVGSGRQQLSADASAPFKLATCLTNSWWMIYADLETRFGWLPKSGQCHSSVLSIC